MTVTITNFEDLQPEWVESILRKNGLIRDVSVRAINILLQKELQVSRVGRIGIEYSSDPPPGAPASIFLKLSKASASPHSNKSEVWFYQTIGVRDPVRPLVRCYEAVYNENNDTSHILMEDLTETHFQSGDGEIPAPALAELAVECLAKFHARWLSHPELGKTIGAAFDQAWLDNFLKELKVSVDSFVDFMGDSLSVERRAAYQFMLAHSRHIWGRLTKREGLTVTHGDVHWWNFLFPHDPERDETRLIDWQLWHIDLGARDLAFLIALGGFAERQPEIEPNLVRRYFDTLTTEGVIGYDWGQFWHDYRLSTVRNLNIPVIFWAQGRSADMYLKLLDRAFEGFDGLECRELFELPILT